MSGDATETFSKIQVAIPLLKAYNDDVPIFNEEKLTRYLTELNRRFVEYKLPYKAMPEEQVSSALVKSKKIVALYKEFNQDEIIVLKADNSYNGIQAWDALMGVGLTWGDGDLFHWPNTSDFGHDQHFSVWTSTTPGYFLPEKVKNGEMNPKDLIFGYSIPRSADPHGVYDVMVNTAKDIQKHIGGTLLNQTGTPLDENADREKVLQLVRQMKTKGIEPGSEKVLTIY